MEYADYNDFQALVAQGNIKRKNLKQNQYTISLMSEGLRTGLLNSQEIIGIQNNLMLVLQNLIWRYTQGESSSVTSETAESIFTSMIYAVDAYLKGYGTPESALEYLKKANIRRTYEEGVEIVNSLFDETKLLYKTVKKNKLDVPVDAYNMTIDESLPIFMKKYGIIFDAHNTMASIDYPLAIDDMRLQGVFYIHQYLQRLHIETEFCRLFNANDLRELLVDYGRVCRFDYRIELFNIYQLVLNNAVFAVLSDGAAGQILLSAYQFEYLEPKLTQKTSEQIDYIVHEAVRRMQNDLGIQDTQIKEYMEKSVVELIQRISNAAHSCSLQAVIITRQEKTTKPVSFSLNADRRMSDLELRNLLAEVAELNSKEQKAQLIKSRLFSLHDYLDLFESGILYDDEYDAVFGLFGDMELAVLAKIIFYEELRSDMLDFMSIIQEHDGSDEEWKMYCIQFMKEMSKERLQSIEQMIQMIDYEEIKFF